ncbi:MAG: hypothetical protein OXI67_17920 [Candidatus Poribacteria bacterium]|nr:hypothetical protein [Candidatus Poribacteria bacterium]
MSINADKKRLIKPHKQKSGQIKKNVDKDKIAAGYAILAEMIGMADFDPPDASVNHDDVIYELQSKK